MQKKHYATIDAKGEVIVFDDVVAWKQNKLTLKEKRVIITLSKFVKHRSTNQNAYYWGVVIELLAGFTGYNPEEMHSALKMKFLKDHNEERFDISKSTTGLDTMEFEMYLSQVRQWASTELGVYIPTVDEVAF